MKCAKCGYISFDYLSECKKCQTSMAAAREGFGFSAAKSAVPSLLASLLRDYQPEAQQKNPAFDTDTYDPFNLQEEIGITLNEGFRIDPPDTARVVADTGESEEDFSLLDLSDEELELLIDRDTFANGEKGQIQSTPLMEAEGAKEPDGPFFSLQSASASPEIAMIEEAAAFPDEELSLSLEDFYETENEAQAPHRLDLAPDSGGEPVRLENSAGPTPEFENAAEQCAVRPDDLTDDFVIDLSESDLDALLKRLEDSTSGKG